MIPGEGLAGSPPPLATWRTPKERPASSRWRGSFDLVKELKIVGAEEHFKGAVRACQASVQLMYD
jgi:hypothetical protein